MHAAGSGLKGYQTLLDREEHELAPVVKVELVPDVADMIANGLRGNRAGPGDFLRALPIRDLGEDLLFTPTQPSVLRVHRHRPRLVDRRPDRCHEVESAVLRTDHQRDVRVNPPA